MTERPSLESLWTRRRVLHGTAALAASALLPGCSSSTSNHNTIGPQTQTITFAMIPPVSFGSAAITLTATASSGLPVSFSVISGPGSISGSTLTVFGVGSIVVMVTQTGNATYAPAPSILQTVTVANTNPQPVPSAVTPASVIVTGTSVGSLAPGFAGLSYEKYQLCQPSFTTSNQSMTALFELLGPSVLRIGGATTDQEVWAPNGKGQTYGQIAPKDVDALAAFLKATGWQCLYAVNLGGSGPAGTAYPTTPALAAAEVAYVVNALGSSLLGIEIGNEPDSYGNSYYAGTTWNETTFEALWEQYRTAILAVTPSAPITGPAVSVTGRIVGWTLPFGQHVTKGQITELTQHYYRANGLLATSTAANLITPDTTLVAALQQLQTGAQGIGLPFRIAEANNYANGGSPGVSNAYASTLWVIDFLFNCVQGGAVGVNLHGGGDATGTGYTPIADNSGTVNGIRPEYYGILLFTLAGQGTLYQTTVNAGAINLTAYAVYTASGGLNLVLNNKDSSNNMQVTVQLPQSYRVGALQMLTQSTAGASLPDLTATTGITIQGSSVSTSGSFSPAKPFYVTPTGNQVTCYVPAQSAVLLRLS